MNIKSIEYKSKEIGSIKVSEQSFVTPCQIITKTGEVLEMCEIHISTMKRATVRYVSLDEVEDILPTSYAIDRDLAQSSLNVHEIRNDYPFFIKMSDGQILGYNAFYPICLTYSHHYKSHRVLGQVSFEEAKEKGFKMLDTTLEAAIFISSKK